MNLVELLDSIGLGDAASSLGSKAKTLIRLVQYEDTEQPRYYELALATVEKNHIELLIGRELLPSEATTATDDEDDADDDLDDEEDDYCDFDDEEEDDDDEDEDD